jgi:dihydrofolate synthase/folylpolyglutamate synthase
MTVGLAFDYFASQQVDIAVIEVGMGGRLDSTNVITPLLSVITNIGFDHTQFLGDTLPKIAAEKAGIIKPGVPVVIGEATPETRAVFDAIAAEQQAPIYYAEDEKEITSATLTSEGMMHYTCVHLGDFECELTGDFQPINMNTMVVALHKLVDRGYLADCIEPKNQALVAEEMSNAFKNVTKITGLMARWQTVRENPRVICDTGHNPAAWHYLGKQLANLKCHQLHIVFGMVEDKDVYSVMALLPKNATYFFTKGSTKRAFPETSLKIFGEQFGLKGECYPTVEEAYEAAMQGATSEDVIFIGGSTYAVADYLKTRI